MRKIDVAIIGDGHAGLNALKEVRGAGCSWVLIDGGPLGTTVTSEAGGVRVKTKTQEVSAERVVVAVGRVSNIPEGLSQLCETDQHGVPRFDPRTLQVGDLPIFIAGDARLCSEFYRSSISNHLA